MEIIIAVMDSVDAVIPWGWDGKHGNTVLAVDVPYCRCFYVQFKLHVQYIFASCPSDCSFHVY